MEVHHYCLLEMKYHDYHSKLRSMVGDAGVQLAGLELSPTRHKHWIRIYRLEAISYGKQLRKEAFLEIQGTHRELLMFCCIERNRIIQITTSKIYLIRWTVTTGDISWNPVHLLGHSNFFVWKEEHRDSRICTDSLAKSTSVEQMM